MAAMTSADITYALQAQRLAGTGRVVRTFKLTFPTGGTNNQYVAGGIPLDKGKLGCPRFINSLKVLGHTPAGADKDPTWDWNGDTVNPTLVATRTGSVAAVRFTQQLAGDTAYGVNEQVVFVEVEGN
jgi:hypothetical protein